MLAASAFMPALVAIITIATIIVAAPHGAGTIITTIGIAVAGADSPRLEAGRYMAAAV
jgi:hypothetical protein